MYAQQHIPDAPHLSVSLEDEAPCPVETEQLRRRFDWRLLLTAPWCVVVNQLWGVAFTDPKYRQEVPVVLNEVEQARQSGIMEVAR